MEAVLVTLGTPHRHPECVIHNTPFTHTLATLTHAQRAHGVVNYPGVRVCVYPYDVFVRVCVCVCLKV